MVVLKQADKISIDRLEKHFQKFDNEPVNYTTALWKHSSCDVVLTFVVDDSGVNYTSRKYVEYLINFLKILYPVTTDWAGSKFGDLPYSGTT